MSGLSPSERRKLEDLFGMSSGYVLHCQADDAMPVACLPDQTLAPLHIVYELLKERLVSQ